MVVMVTVQLSMRRAWDRPRFAVRSSLFKVRTNETGLIG